MSFFSYTLGDRAVARSGRRRVLVGVQRAIALCRSARCPRIILPSAGGGKTGSLQQPCPWRGLCLCNLDLPCILIISRYHSSPSHVATYLAFFIVGVVQVVTVHLVESSERSHP